MNEEIWGEFERLSRRMARIEVALTERIIALEAEVKALKAQPQIADWRQEGAAQAALAEIMQR